MAKLTVKHTNYAIYAAAVLLLCAKAEYTAAQEQMRQQLALQGLASAGQTPYLAIHLMAQVDTWDYVPMEQATACCGSTC